MYEQYRNKTNNNNGPWCTNWLNMDEDDEAEAVIDEIIVQTLWLSP